MIIVPSLMACLLFNARHTGHRPGRGRALDKSCPRARADNAITALTIKHPLPMSNRWLKMNQTPLCNFFVKQKKVHDNCILLVPKNHLRCRQLSRCHRMFVAMLLWNVKTSRLFFFCERHVQPTNDCQAYSIRYHDAFSVIQSEVLSTILSFAVSLYIA